MRQTRGRGSDGIELNLGNGQIAAVVLVALALLGVAFALGLKVGQQIGADEAMAAADARAQDRLAALDARAQAMAEPPAPAGDVAGESARPAAGTLTFAQELTKPAQSAERPAPVPAPAPAPGSLAEQRAAADVPPPGRSGAAAPALPPAAPAAQAPAPAQERESLLAAFAKAAPASAGFALQVASLPNARAAQAEADRLSAKGLSAWVRAAEVRGSTYYRVKVGPYATKAEAQAALAGVAQASGARPIVVNAD